MHYLRIVKKKKERERKEKEGKNSGGTPGLPGDTLYTKNQSDRGIERNSIN